MQYLVSIVKCPCLGNLRSCFWKASFCYQFLIKVLFGPKVSSKTYFNFLGSSETLGKKYWVLHYPGLFRPPNRKDRLSPQKDPSRLDIFTARNNSCGKVMFLQVSVCPRGGGMCMPVCIGLSVWVSPGGWPWGDVTIEIQSEGHLKRCEVSLWGSSWHNG